MDSFDVENADAALAGTMTGAVGIIPELVFRVSDMARFTAGPKIELELELNVQLPPFAAIPDTWSPAAFYIGSCQAAHYIQYKVPC